VTFCANYLATGRRAAVRMGKPVGVCRRRNREASMCRPADPRATYAESAGTELHCTWMHVVQLQCQRISTKAPIALCMHYRERQKVSP